MRERDERIQQRGRELVGLVARQLPQEFEVTGDTAAGWPAIGVALVSRMATTLGSILDLQAGQREADTATLARSLYEHAVHFAWLAEDPEAVRLEAWRRDDLRQRLKADADASHRGLNLLSPGRRDEYKAQVAGLRGHSLKLVDLAAEADASWAGKLPGMGQTDATSFRGMYSTLYRLYSGTAHPSVLGLNRVVDELGPTRRRVRLEGEYQSNGPYGIATVIFAVGLFVAGQSIGWPPAAEVLAVFDRHPD